MTLGELIERLEKESPAKVIRNGFTKPHSYRGYYDELAFVPTCDVSVGDMLRDARSARNVGFGGWKGGVFLMNDYTTCWLANIGCCGEQLGSRLLNYMLADEA